ncbi:MAG: Gfo/Idh/MocA family oxidoreductase [Bacteroidaceae bacterium]|nr:Gfo/Idh/MocA family oxidoreductase [Bacteroidaceae bacterium]
MKISIAGTGKIVEEVLQMLQREFQGEIEVTGIFARDQSVEHAIDLCMAYAPGGFVYTDYERMLQEAEADFVYIANANHVHYDYARRALMAGRSVIVEKPLTLTRAETEALYDLAIERTLYCLPAFSLLYMPLFEELVKVLPQIGTVRLVECNYSQYSSRYDRYLQGIMTPAFDPSQGGGALMDINIYNLCFTVALFGPPRTVQYQRNLGYNGVDTSGTLLLQYPGFVASLSGAKDCDGPSHGIIQGERGYIRVDGPVSTMRQFTLCLRGQDSQVFRASEGPHRLSYEFRAFQILADNHPESRLNIPYLSRTALEIAIAVEKTKL